MVLGPRLKRGFDRAVWRESSHVILKLGVRLESHRPSWCVRPHECEMHLKLSRQIGSKLHFGIAVVPFEENVFPFNSKHRLGPDPVVAQLSQELHRTFEVAANAILRIAVARRAVDGGPQQVEFRCFDSSINSGSLGFSKGSPRPSK